MPILPAIWQPPVVRPAPYTNFVAAGEALWIDFAVGDLISLAADTSGATAYLLVLDMQGDVAPALLSLEALPFTSALGEQDFAISEAAMRLAACGRKLSELKWAAYLLPDEPLVLCASDSGVLLAVCRGGAAQTAHDGGDSFAVAMQKAAKGEPAAPPALGKLRESIHIPRGTARAYEVRAGEYVQIIDLEGKQCSDFMAFSARALDAGKERYIDTAVTRTIAGGAYPLPGLYDKFYDQDIKPLLSVEQDTVGRHDTFALACTARGYEERGFPGHINCSDNISGEFLHYGIAERCAWPAINFFFNSWITPHDSRLRVDEAWSKPGDFVLLRAMVDLLCVSTACPDDIDPINGWQPTDIGVRIYSDIRSGKRLVYRSFPALPKVMSTESPFHSRTAALTSRFVVAKNMWTPAVFDASGALDEYWTCRQRVTVQDMSALRKLDVCGPDAEYFLQHACTRDIHRLSVHRSVYALFCDARGAVIDDATVSRLAAGLFRVCYGSDELILHLRELAAAMNCQVWLHDKSRMLCNLSVQGPDSRAVMEKLIFTQPTQPKVTNLKWFGLTLGRLHDRDGAAIMVSRSGYTGELGYELFCDRRDASAVWDAVFAIGREYGIKPMGTEALEMLRIEAGLMANNADFGGDHTPAECGLLFAVDMRKDDFVGRTAIAEHKPRHVIAGIRVEANDAPAAGDTVFVGRRPIGEVTSAVLSPQIKRPIALARINGEHAMLGEELEIGRLDGHIKRLPAVVCALPFIDPERKKPRS